MLDKEIETHTDQPTERIKSIENAPPEIESP